MRPLPRIVHAAASECLVGLAPALTDPELPRRWSHRHGRPASLPELLDDLDRQTSTPSRRPRHARRWFGWDREDATTRAWMPQGISTSGDADPRVADREVVAVSWYSPREDGVTRGVRVTFVDLAGPDPARYRHVLLVEPGHSPGPAHGPWSPVPVHAGGLAWHRNLLYVAATYAGVRVFDLAHLTRVRRPELFLDHRFVLPQLGAYGPAGDPAARMRYSFLSVDHGASGPGLLAGEYGPPGSLTRLVRYGLDPQSGRLRAPGVLATPDLAFALPVPRMQGVTRLGATFAVTASRGPLLRGDLWLGDTDHGFRRHRGALPVAPESVCAWPSRDELWTLTEWPGRRYVFALPGPREPS